MTASKKVGIAMAVYKPVADHFYKQLESIQNQTYKNWVCVMCFDSPVEMYLSDHRFEIFRKDVRFVWLQNRDRLGVKKNFERAIRECEVLEVDFIACSDQDDIWYPEKVAVSVEELSWHQPLSLVHSDMHVFIEGSTAPMKTAWELEQIDIAKKSTEHFLVRNIVAGASMMFDAELVRMYPEIPEGVPYHDHWFAMVASAHGGIYSISKPLYAYRNHAENVLGTTEFVSTFSLKNIGAGRVFDKCLDVYGKSRKLTEEARRARLVNSPIWNFVFLKPYDMGLTFLGMGVANFFSNKPLARAYFARALGKSLFVLKKMAP